MLRGARGGSYPLRGALCDRAEVLVGLGAVGYAVHRRLATAVVDAVLAGVVFAPALALAVLLVATIRDCSFGTGC